MGLKKFLIRFEHAIYPWNALLCAMVRVDENGNAICWRVHANNVCPGNRAQDRCLEFIIWHAFANDEGSAIMRKLDHDGTSNGLTRFKDRIDSACAGAIESRNGITV